MRLLLRVDTHLGARTVVTQCLNAEDANAIALAFSAVDWHAVVDETDNGSKTMVQHMAERKRKHARERKKQAAADDKVTRLPVRRSSS